MLPHNVAHVDTYRFSCRGAEEQSMDRRFAVVPKPDDIRGGVCCVLWLLFAVVTGTQAHAYTLRCADSALALLPPSLDSSSVPAIPCGAKPMSNASARGPRRRRVLHVRRRRQSSRSYQHHEPTLLERAGLTREPCLFAVKYGIIMLTGSYHGEGGTFSLLCNLKNNGACPAC